MTPGDFLSVVIFSTYFPGDGHFSGFLTYNLCDVTSISGVAATAATVPITATELPAPTASTLGGVQSATGATGQFITGIDTSGVPQLATPDYSQIGGTPTLGSLAALSALPNPSASSLGGVQSYGAVSSQWINSISTSGVPSSSQPAFSDISGTVAAAQLPAPTASALGGVQAATGATGQFITGIDTSGIPRFANPLGWQNVVLYGATGNGTTDDSAAINAAIAAAGSGGTIYFPNGTYKIGATGLTLSASVKFLGASQDGTILQLGAAGTTHVSPANGSPSSATVFINVTAGSVEFENITVNSNSNAYYSLYFSSGINNITLRQATIKGGTYGLFLQNNSNVLVSGCSFILNSLHQAFYSSTTTSSGVNFNNNYFDPQGANAATTTASVDLWFQGVLSGALTNVVVDNNIFNYAGLGAVEVDGLVFTTSGSSSAMSLITISNNVITMNTGSSSSGNGIEISGPSLVDVSGNTINVAGQMGILLEIQGTTIVPKGTITGNTVVGTNPTFTTYGILLVAGSWTVSGNYIKGFEYCIGVVSDPQIIVGNVFELLTSGGPGGTQGGINYNINGGKGTNISSNLFYAPAPGSFMGISMSTTTTLSNFTCNNNTFYNISYGIYFWNSPTCSNTLLTFNEFASVSAPYTNVPSSGCLVLGETSSGALQIGASAKGGAALGYALFTPLLYASLPSSPSFGMRACITDSTVQDAAANYGATVSGGGSYNAFVKYNGSNWVIG
jgi:hypothetical protein